MALIEISNSYISDTAAGADGRSRFVVIGEPVVAVDLINTVAAPGSPERDDLLSTDLGAQAWWRAERARVPGGDLPDIEGLRRLRRALRDTIEALMIFIAVNPRRSWCAPGVCGNRVRVARHHRRAGGA